jgi:DNA-binding HxlR family transcriptional regulator
MQGGALPTARSYHDQCTIARALDVVGERWALLIVRELLFGPQRFSELRRALTNTSANVITDRLRELEDRGVIRRRKLALPAGSWVYELTRWGRQLEPVLIALGGWGVQIPPPSPPNVLTGTSALIYLRCCARPDPTVRSVVGVVFDDQIWTVRTEDGDLTIEVGDTAKADATITTDPYTFNEIIGDVTGLHSVVAAGRASVDGDLKVLQRLLEEIEIEAGLQAPLRPDLSAQHRCDVGGESTSRRPVTEP